MRGGHVVTKVRGGVDTTCRTRPWALLPLLLAMTMIVASCGLVGNDGPAPPDVSISATTGNFSTTVRPNRTTEMPFAEQVRVDVEFEREVIGLAGQTAVFVEVEPAPFRATPITPRDRNTYSFIITSRSAGEVTVRVFEDRDAVPVTFTLDIGGRED